MKPSDYRFTKLQVDKPAQTPPLEKLHQLLSEAVSKRILTIPFDKETNSVLCMFSGGLDSTILACLLADLLPEDINLELINVSFSPSDSPDRITSILSYYELLERNKKRQIRLICADQYKITDLMHDSHLK